MIPVCDCHREPKRWAKNKHRSFGGYWICSVTANESSRRWTSNNSVKKGEYARHRAIETKDWLDSLKSAPCPDCGNNYPPECMDWDHVRGTKLFNISRGYKQSRAALLAEINKCELVCSNCHRIRTKKRRRDGD